MWIFTHHCLMRVHKGQLDRLDILNAHDIQESRKVLVGLELARTTLRRDES